MRSVGIKVLKNNLSEYVRAASAGETVLVTDRDRVVAELRPPKVDKVAAANALRIAHGRPPLSPFEEQGVREGWMTPATEFGPLPPPSYPAIMTFDEMIEDLAESRGDR